MPMTPGLRKFALTIHLASSVGWIGAAAAYLVLGVSALTSADAQTVRSAWIAMELTGWFVLVPSALAALLTGLVMALGTPWGLFRHYWVLMTLVLTILSTVVLLLHMPTVSSLAEVAREADGADLGGLGGDVLHSGLGLMVLLVITVINVYKPRGMTRYGWRKQHERPGSRSRRRVGPQGKERSEAAQPIPLRRRRLRKWLADRRTRRRRHRWPVIFAAVALVQSP